MPSQSSRRFFTLLLAVSCVLVVLLIRPLAQMLLFGAVIAAELYPVQTWLTQKLGGRRTLSAVLVALAFTLVILVPVTVVGASVLKGFMDAIAALGRVVKDQGIEGLLAKVPGVIRGRVEDLYHPTPERAQQMNGQLATVASHGVRMIGKFLSTVGTVVVTTGLTLIALIVFLIDGPALVKWIKGVTPLEPGEVSEIFREFKSVTSSVLVGNVATSAVQSLVALLGYLIARMPQPIVATVITFIASFIPGIGGSLTVVIASGVLFLTGERWRALFLLVWALAVVGVVDNVVKPLFIKHGLALHGAVVFFSVVAGLAAFGPIGLLTGPLVMVLFLTLVRIYGRDYAPSPSVGPTTPSEGLPPYTPEPSDVPAEHHS